MSTVLVRLREPVMRLAQAQADKLIKAGLLEPATEYQAGTPAEPEALIRVKDSGMILGSYYNKAEIVGCSEKDAVYFTWRSLATRVTREERDAEVAAARERERARTEDVEMVLVRFLRSWAVFGTYYGTGEVAGFSGERLDYVLAARLKDGDPFVQALTKEQTATFMAGLEADAAAAAAELAGGIDHLVIVKFLISMSACGSYYNAGELAGFTKAKAEDLLAAHTLDNRPFAELVHGHVAPAPESIDGTGLEIPEGVDVAGLTDRDPEGVASKQEADRETAEREGKGLDEPPKNRMLDRFRRK